MLAPFTGLGATNTNSQPYYTNTAGNLIGGATAGLGLYNAFKNAGGSGGGGQLGNPGSPGAGYQWGNDIMYPYTG
jgi:hypothetical protein